MAVLGRGSGVSGDVAPRLAALEEQMATVLYTASSVTSVTVDGASPRIVEVGQSVGPITLGWSLNKTISGTGASLATTGAGAGAVALGARSKSIAGPFTTDQTFGVTMNDGSGRSGAAASRSASLLFQSRLYYGVAVGPTLTNAEILALGGLNELTTSVRTRKTTTFNPAGQRIFLCQPAAWPIATPNVNGFPEPAFTDVIQTVVNAFGGSVSYRIRRLNNVLTGAFEVVW